LLQADFKLKLRHFELQAKLQVAEEILVLVGPSGAGKTTILKCLAGLLTPSVGTILINGRTVYSSADKINLPARKRRVGYVFQEYALFPHMTVEKNVLYGLGNKKKRNYSFQVDEMLEMLGILHLKNRFPAHISGGEKQRVALARALMAEPEIMLLDEPLSALDPEIRSELQQELKKIQKQWKIPFVLVTHDPREAEILGDQIIKIDRGRLTALKESSQPEKQVQPSLA